MILIHCFCFFSQELQRNTADLQKSKSELEKQRTEFDKKVMEVIALKKSHQEQEAELKYEIDRLKGQLQRAKDDYARAQEKNKKVWLSFPVKCSGFKIMAPLKSNPLMCPFWVCPAAPRPSHCVRAGEEARRHTN